MCLFSVRKAGGKTRVCIDAPLTEKVLIQMLSRVGLALRVAHALGTIRL